MRVFVSACGCGPRSVCDAAGWVETLQAAGHQVVEQEQFKSYRSAFDEIATADVVLGLVNEANGTQWAIELSAAVVGHESVSSVAYMGGAKPTFLWWGSDGVQPPGLFDEFVDHGAVRLLGDARVAQAQLVETLAGGSCATRSFYEQFFSTSLDRMGASSVGPHRTTEAIPADWPIALQALHAIAGEHWLNREHNRVLPPSRITASGTKMIFAEENQQVVVWAIDRSDQDPDPLVWQGQPDGADSYVWYVEDRPLTTFITDMWRWALSLG